MADDIVHLAPAKVPPGGEHVMPCCKRQTTDMDAGVLLTVYPERVTCPGPADPPAAEDDDG